MKRDVADFRKSVELKPRHLRDMIISTLTIEVMIDEPNRSIAFLYLAALLNLGPCRHG